MTFFFKEFCKFFSLGVNLLLIMYQVVALQNPDLISNILKLSFAQFYTAQHLLTTQIRRQCDSKPEFNILCHPLLCYPLAGTNKKKKKRRTCPLLPRNCLRPRTRDAKLIRRSKVKEITPPKPGSALFKADFRPRSRVGHLFR